MKQFDKRMNVMNNGKSALVHTILTGCFDNVVDLGCGQCIVEQGLISAGYEGNMICVDINKPTLPKSVLSKIHFIKKDLAKYCLDDLDLVLTGKTCYILSAVLHECNTTTRDKISKFIQTTAKTGDLVLIREPYYDDVLNTSVYGQLIDEACHNHKDLKKLEEYILLPKKACTIIPNYILIVNYAFLQFYGPRAWKRESHEGRYTFNKNEIINFIESCSFRLDTIQYEKDSGYTNLKFGKIDLFPLLRYTSCLFIARKDEQ